MRDVTIKRVLNGYVVNVGCKTLVFTNIEHVCGELRRYSEKPKEIEIEYLSKSGEHPGIPDVPYPEHCSPVPICRDEAQIAMNEIQRNMDKRPVNVAPR